jgi:hypothetical protein
MKLKCILPCIIFFTYACANLKPIHSISQGLSGYILLSRGNQMPSPGRIAGKGSLRVSREIYIYQPTTINQTLGSSPLFKQINTHLIAKTKSDSTGYYEINLPTGNYSVFILDKGQFFASESDGDGVINPVQILSNTVTKKTFNINYQAAY